MNDCGEFCAIAVFSLAGRSLKASGVSWVIIGTVHIFSIIVGVTSTQIYLQGIFAAKNVKEAPKGAFLSAAFISPAGIFGVIGLYLHAGILHHWPE